MVGHTVTALCTAMLRPQSGRSQSARQTDHFVPGGSGHHKDGVTGRGAGATEHNTEDSLHKCTQRCLVLVADLAPWWVGH